MKISIAWLKEFLDADVPVRRLVETLERIGLMVEGEQATGDDIVLDVETYSNRPDTLGHLGMARELAAALGAALKPRSWPLAELPVSTRDVVDVQVSDGDLCPRYCGLVVRGVRVGPSPDWLRTRIVAMGLNPVNNVVDVTNYVLFATSQPIHAFDLQKIGGAKIIVRRARKGEGLVCLDGTDLALLPDMLVIADDSRPVALAGVIGGQLSAVSEGTQDVFIESACFDPVSVRLTRKAAGLQTDASYRFERGSDIGFPPQAALMAASLLTQFGAKSTQGVIDIFPQPRKKKEVILRHRRVGELLGVEVEEAFIEKMLQDLEFSVETQQAGVWRVRVPSFRVDIDREADLIEEVARFFGYENIPSVVPPLTMVEPVEDKNAGKLDRIRPVLQHLGFTEVISFSFSDPAREAVLENGIQPMEIRNPISAKASLLRTSLIGGLMEATAWNRNRGLESVHIFEVGNVYGRDEQSCREYPLLGLMSTGPLGEPHWRGKARDSDLFRIKGALEAMMGQIRYEPYSFESADHPYFEPGTALSLTYKEQLIGRLGKVAGRIREFYGVKQGVFAAEIDLACLFEKQPRVFAYVPVPKFPAITRDVSLLVPRAVPYQELKKAMEKLSLPLLEGFELVDRYAGEGIPEDMASLTFRQTYRHPQRTLQSEEVEKTEQQLLNQLKRGLGARLREGG
ncbi:MAG: phenylalanine--tRNA ligase subunit beta [Candidatus Aminicenantes bacterium RBG_16_63_16]|nr:MAG: phenylalanine--tRNA ligase subunit beta [Candidatus Aminicenantes bacterium RBG_16_63_16]